MDSRDPGPKINVLLVDDRPENLLALEAILEHQDINLVRASSGEDALVQVMRNDFAVILMDVMMPEMSGFETVEWIKQRAKSQHTPIIFLTAIGTGEQDARQGYSLGAVDYLTKPLDADILKAKVGVFIDLYRQAEQIRQQAAMLDETYDAIMARDFRTGQITFWNGGAERMYGWSKSEILGQPLHQRLQTVFPCPLAEIEQLLLVAGHWEGELEHRRRDGAQVKVESRWSLLRNEAGQPRTVVIISKDLTVQKHAQEVAEGRSRALDTQRQFLQRIIDNAPAGIAYLDRHLIYQWINPTQARFFGIPAEQILGRSILEVLGPDTEQQIGPLLHRCIEQGEPSFGKAFPFTFQVDDHQVQSYWDFTFQPMRGTDGQVDGVLALALEVSDRVEKERLQHDQFERLQEVDKMKDQFLSVVSHELRTPLNFIMGFGSLMEDEVAGPLTEQQHQYVAKMLHGADRMLILVNDLLDFAKIQAGGLDLKPVPTPYEPIVQEVLDTMDPMLSDKEIRVTLDIQVPGLPCLDGMRVVQVLSNLVSNAIKFSPRGSTIALRAFLRDQELVSEVSDQGIGISPEDQARLFQPFHQVDSSYTRKTGGTGLGLAIVKAIVECHGGHMELESTPGQGSVFRFFLPARTSICQEG